MEVGHWLNTVGVQSRSKEENPEYGQGKFLLLLAKLYSLSVRDR